MPPLLRADGTAVFCPKEKAVFLADIFDNKQYRDSLLLPWPYFSGLKLCSVALRSREVN